MAIEKTLTLLTLPARSSLEEHGAARPSGESVYRCRRPLLLSAPLAGSRKGQLRRPLSPTVHLDCLLRLEVQRQLALEDPSIALHHLFLSPFCCFLHHPSAVKMGSTNEEKKRMIMYVYQPDVVANASYC